MVEGRKSAAVSHQASSQEANIILPCVGSVQVPAVRTNVGLDVDGQLVDGGQVDAKQLRAPVERRRDRPAEVRIVGFPGPHGRKVTAQMFEDKQQQGRSSGGQASSWIATGAAVGPP